MQEYANLNQIIEDFEEFDGMSISVRKNEEDYDVWKFVNIKFKEEESELNYEIFPMGKKYSILYLSKNGSVDYTEAILIDPKVYIKVLVESGQEAIIMKKCNHSLDLLKSFLAQRIIDNLKYLYLTITE